MDKSHRSLLTLARNKSLVRRNSIGSHPGGDTRCVTTQPHHRPHEALNLIPKRGLDRLAPISEVPFFVDLKPYKKRVAITDPNGDFTYEDLFKRSLYLSLDIKKALKGRPNQKQHIALTCPNGVSYVIGQWAIWMSGNVVVPLSGQHTDDALKFFIEDTDSALVITAPPLMEKVEPMVTKLGKPLICQDLTSEAHTNIIIDDNGPFPSPIFNENLYNKDDAAMLLYLPGDRSTRLYLKHIDLNRELELINKVWNLDENSSMLHALSLYNPFGIVASLMSPLSVGGRVVLLPQFDTKKVWSHLLGIGEAVPRTNVYAGEAIHYESLIKQYQEVFKNPKIKDYVHETCSKRINLMVNGIKCVDGNSHKQWTKMTGHEIQFY